MTDSASTILLTREQSTGSNVNLWGGYLITTQRQTEQASKGVQNLAVTGDATISWTNYTTGNTGQCAVLRLTGTLAAAATLTFPGYQNWMIVTNAAGKTVTIKCSGGTGVAIPNNTIAYIFCDATDYYSAGPTTLPSYVATLTNAGDIVVKTTLETAIATASLPATAGTILVSAADASAGYAGTKVTVAGTGAATVTASTTNPGANEIKVWTVSVGALGLTAGAAQTTSFAAAVNTRYNLAKSAALTITLPAAPAVGDVVWVDISGTSGLVTWSLNGLKAYGSTVNPTSAAEGSQAWSYSGASRGWIDL